MITLAVLSSCRGQQRNPVPCDWHAARALQVTAAPEKGAPQAAAVGGSAVLQLLCDCSGAFQPGVLTALVGSSGAGKTTLMDVLAGRKTGALVSHCQLRHRGKQQQRTLSVLGKPPACSTGGKITGNMSVGGFPKDQATFRRAMGYCEQNDVHAPYVSLFPPLHSPRHLRTPGLPGPGSLRSLPALSQGAVNAWPGCCSRRRWLRRCGSAAGCASRATWTM